MPESSPRSKQAPLVPTSAEQTRPDPGGQGRGAKPGVILRSDSLEHEDGTLNLALSHPQPEGPPSSFSLSVISREESREGLNWPKLFRDYRIIIARDFMGKVTTVYT